MSVQKEIDARSDSSSSPARAILILGLSLFVFVTALAMAIGPDPDASASRKTHVLTGYRIKNADGKTVERIHFLRPTTVVWRKHCFDGEPRSCLQVIGPDGHAFRYEILAPGETYQVFGVQEML